MSEFWKSLQKIKVSANIERFTVFIIKVGKCLSEGYWNIPHQCIIKCKTDYEIFYSKNLVD